MEKFSFKKHDLPSELFNKLYVSNEQQQKSSLLRLKLENKNKNSMLFQVNNSNKTLIQRRQFLTEHQESNSYQEQEQTQEQLIQQLLQKKIHLQKQNNEKDNEINQILNNKRHTICLTQGSRSQHVSSKSKVKIVKSNFIMQLQLEKKNDQKQKSDPFGFTFQKIQKDDQLNQFSSKSGRLPKEFQIVPNKNRYFV